MAIELATAYISLVPTTQGIQGAVGTAMAGTASAAKGAGAAAGTQYATGMTNALKGAAGIAVVAGAVNVVGGAVDEAREAQKVGAGTEAIIKATGGAANVTADQVAALSTALSNKTGVDDEVIQTGANMLLTFKNVRNEAGEGANVFDRATAAAGDLSAAGFGSIDSASTMLGKALNDPIAGLTSLGRVGVQFTQDQKDQIKTLVESGDVLGAQQIILAEVESQVGGTAAATATAGEKMSVAWGNFQETLGTMLLPVLDAVQGAMAAIFGYLSQNAPVLYTIIGAVALLTAAWLANKVASLAVATAETAKAVAVGISTGAAKTAAAAQWLWNAAMSANPIGLVIAAIAALVAGLIWFFTQTEVGKAIIETVWGAIQTAIGAVTSWWTDTALPLLSGGWDAIKGLFESGRDVVSGVMDTILGVIEAVWSYSPLGLVVENWDAIMAFFAEIPGRIGDVLSGVGEAIMEAFKSPFNAVAGFWNDSLGSIGFDIPDWVPLVGGNSWHFPQIPLLAAGGVISSPTLAMVGEGSEPEAVLPLSKLEAMLDVAPRGAGAEISVYPTPGMSEEQVGTMVASRLAWEMAR